MTPERYQLIDRIFQTALALEEPGERAAYLNEACSGDETLRREVDSLITSDGGGLSFIDEPAFEMAASLLASDEPALAAGEHLDHYEVVSLLGAGGMGEVYLAHDEKLDRKIALKLLPSDFTTNEERLRRFQQEARAASALNHPNIITIHEIGQVDHRHFIATEFVDGETLRQRMKRGALSLDESLDIAIQVCSALSAAHKAGIVHRDIKPENIMLRTDGYAKVLDFGLAKLTQQEETPTVQGADEKVDVSSGLVMGTVKYMSPEQAQGLRVDQRSDIFSLGVVLYEMLTGRAPFEGKTAGEMTSAITSRESPPLKHYAPGTPDELQRVVTKALSKEAEARYQTAEEILSDLKRCKDESTARGGAHLFGLIKQHRASASLALAILAIVASLILFGLYKFFRGSHVPFQNIELTKLTNFGDAWTSAISPDGKSVIYIKGEGLDKPSTKHSVCLRPIGTTTEIQLIPPTEGYWGATTFSPDGKYVAYGLQLPDQEVTTFSVPVSGGNATNLHLNGADGISYSPDGQRLAYIYNNLSQGKTSVVVANADGTGGREVVTRQAPDYFYGLYPPSWAPDGKRLACIGQYGTESFPRVIEVDVEAGTERPITAQRWSSMKAVAWLPRGNGLLVTASEETSAIQQIWHISYSNGEARRITNGTVSYFSLSLTADGTALVTDASSAPTSIWTVPVTSPQSTDNGSSLYVDTNRSKQINVTNFVGAVSFNYLRYAWTPEGRIVYVSQESGNADIWSMNADGSDRRQLTTDPHSDTWPAVSPDGRYIVFMSNRAGAENIWRMDLDGGNQTRLTSERIERCPAFSPDGKFVFYNSWSTGKATAWKIPIESGQPTQVITDPSFEPTISPDGHLLAYFSSRKIVVVPVEGGSPTKTFDGGGRNMQWTPDGRALTYLVNRDFVPNLWMQPLDGGEPKQLTNFTSNGISNYAWSRDGKQLVVARTTFYSDIVLIRDLR